MVSKSAALTLLAGQHSVKSRVAADLLGYTTTLSVRNLVRAGKLATEKVGTREFILCESLRARINE
jgi:hypothetical protein